MKTLFTFLFLALLIGSVCLLPKMPIPDKEAELRECKEVGLAHRDTSEMRRQALIKIYSSPYWGSIEKDY